MKNSRNVLLPKNNNKIEKQLRKKAGEKVYARGVGYFNNKKIFNLTVEKFEDQNNYLSISGEVYGDDIYVGNFIFDLKKNIILDNCCDCPYVGFCKHTVALALEFNDRILNK